MPTLKNERITSALSAIFFVCAIAIVAIFALASFFVTYVYPENWSESHVRVDAFRLLISFFNALLLAAILFAITLKFNFKNPSKVRIVCTFITIAISLLWCTFANYGPVYDSVYMLQGVNQVISGTRLSGELQSAVDDYFSLYPFQIGYMTYCYIVALLFRVNNYFAYRVLNIVMAVVIVNILPKIVELLTHNKKASSLTCILITAFLPLSFFSTFLYGNIISLAFCLVASYQALQIDFSNKRNAARHVSIMAVSLFFALWFKLNASIFYIALGLWFVLCAIKHKAPAYLLLVALLVIVYAITNFALSYTLHMFFPNLSLEPMPLVCWLSLGLIDSDKSPGWWNSYVTDLVANSNRESLLMANEAIQVVHDRVSTFTSDPAYALWFFGKKDLTQWSEPTFGSLFWSFCGINTPNQTGYYYDANSLLQDSFMNGSARVIYETYCDAFQSVIYVLATVGLIVQFRKKNVASVLFVIVFLGGFLYHTLFEAKSTYVMPYFILLIMFAAIGLNFACTRANSKFNVIQSNSV